MTNKEETKTQSKQPLFHTLSLNEERLRDDFQNCSDFIIHPVYVDDVHTISFVYLNTLIDKNLFMTNILQPLLYEGMPKQLNDIDSLKQLVSNKLVASSPLKTVATFEEMNDDIVKGSVVLLIDGLVKALSFNLVDIKSRSIEEPSTEKLIRGPKDGFIESIETNISLIRKRIRSHKLKFVRFTLGKTSKTDIIISYMDGIANQQLIDEVKKRIEKIDVEIVIESEIVEEFIEDNPYTPFPLIQNTERPDAAVASLMQGKVIVLVDHTPFVLIVPMTFWNGFEATGDAYERFIYISSVRILRIVMITIAVFLPSIYVALTTFHPKLIPSTLLISLAGSRENVPFPAIVEAFIMEFVFEALREAGLRLPKAIGQAVSIVGAIVIGQAAVEAGIVSPAMVIIVATTGIASFSVPKYNAEIAFRIIRFPILLLAGLFGLYGVVIAFIFLMIHLVGLHSFQTPYFKPVAPQIPSDMKDILIRTPKWFGK